MEDEEVEGVSEVAVEEDEALSGAEVDTLDMVLRFGAL